MDAPESTVHSSGVAIEEEPGKEPRVFAASLHAIRGLNASASGHGAGQATEGNAVGGAAASGSQP